MFYIPIGVRRILKCGRGGFRFLDSLGSSAVLVSCQLLFSLSAYFTSFAPPFFFLSMTYFSHHAKRKVLFAEGNAKHRYRDMLVLLWWCTGWFAVVGDLLLLECVLYWATWEPRISEVSWLLISWAERLTDSSDSCVCNYAGGSQVDVAKGNRKWKRDSLRCAVSQRWMSSPCSKFSFTPSL